MGRVKIRFPKPEAGEFYDAVKKRVDTYFQRNQLSPFANKWMYIKVAVLFSIYFVLLISIYSNYFSGLNLIAIYTLLGFVISLICCNFCHDLLHGAYFKSPRLNKLFGYLYDVHGLSSYLWRITHNIKHHTFTNIPGHDEDIDKAIILRLQPTDKRYFFHRYQHIYAFFLYLFTSLNWAYYSDWKGLYEESSKVRVPLKDILLFVLFKFIHLTIFLFMPLVLLSAPWWQIVIGFINLHFAGGLFSAIIFQLAHVVENVSYPEPNENGYIPNKWAIHEMETTSNFASASPFWTWMTGGLNHQIEHHLFPYICHIHYPELHKIVKQTALEFNVPYHEQRSFYKAICSHIRTLKKLGSS